jgi:small subunit ribosomal protein S33
MSRDERYDYGLSKQQNDFPLSKTLPQTCTSALKRNFNSAWTWRCEGGLQEGVEQLYRYQCTTHVRHGSPSLKDSRPDEGELPFGALQNHSSAHQPQVQCGIFSTIFNPTSERLGNKVLRQRLRGPALAAYYPRRVATFKDLQKLYPGFETYNQFEEDRLEHLQIAKSRGKGAPKKKRTAAGKIRWKTQVSRGPRLAVLTGFTQRARSSTARRGNERILGFHTGIHCAAFGDMVYRRRDCTVWVRKYHGYECRLPRPRGRQVCMYNILFTLHHSFILVEHGRTCTIEPAHVSSGLR